MYPVQTVKQFITDSYQLVSPNTPTSPLHGNDMTKGVQFFNQLLNQYSATGLLTPIAKEIVFPIAIGQMFMTFGSPLFVPTPDITQGRLSNLQNAWLELENVTYPLMIENRNTFYSSYKFQPQLGLPRFVIIQNQTNLTQVQFYPAPSQVYEVHFYGKFQFEQATENSDLSFLPDYAVMFFQFAVAKFLAFYKGRVNAWSELHEDQYRELQKDLESASSVNLNIETEQESYLNGAWRVRAGV